MKNDLHPTMKPVALVERAIRNSSKSRDIVLDPFGGSGSTLIACEKAGRQARLIELDPKYVDTIILRWQEFSGGTASPGRRGRATKRSPPGARLLLRDVRGSLALRNIDEPAAASADECADDVDANALTDTGQRRSCACEHIHLAPGPDF